MRQIPPLLFGALLALLATASQAQPVNPGAAKRPAVAPSAPTERRPAPDMLLELKSKYPATTFREVNTTPIPGVFEVVMGNNVAYVDRSGRYFMFGRVWDMATQTDLTEAKAGPLQQQVEQGQAVDRRQAVANLPLADAIKSVRGNGKRVLYVFADPNCGFCKRLDETLLGLNDATIYTFLLPILGQDSVAKTDAIWCSPNRAQAYDAWMTKNIQPSAPAQPCASPTQRNLALGRALGVDGTPAMFTPDGRSLSGARPLEQIQAFLDAAPVAQAR